MKRNKYDNEKTYINDKINAAIEVECWLLWLLWSIFVVTMAMVIYSTLNKFGII